MGLDPGPPATVKGYMWGNMKLGGEKAEEFVSKI